MTRPIKPIVFALLMACALMVGTPLAASKEKEAVTLSFGSGTSWKAYDRNPSLKHTRPIGRAQEICVEIYSPETCPYLQLPTIDGASWVWGPGVSLATVPADLTSFFFTKSFKLKGRPTSGALQLAADDFAAVRVNNILVGSIGSVSDLDAAAAAQSSLTFFDITDQLRSGRNTITIEVQNGPAWFSGAGCDPCSYANNPGGAIFGGSLTYKRDWENDDSHDD